MLFRSLEIVPLGGLGEFGMNMLALTWGETTIVIDAGVMFPDPDLLGVDRIIPDQTYLDEKGLEAQNIFIEEYLSTPKSADDQDMEVDIYVFIK